MLKPRYTTQFKKDYKVVVKRGYKTALLEDVIRLLCEEQPLPEKNRDHALTGSFVGFRECHIQPDWLLIYAVNSGTNTIHFIRTGSHADLFG